LRIEQVAAVEHEVAGRVIDGERAAAVGLDYIDVAVTIRIAVQPFDFRDVEAAEKIVLEKVFPVRAEYGPVEVEAHIAEFLGLSIFDEVVPGGRFGTTAASCGARKRARP
jgi:hypothetical protein